MQHIALLTALLVLMACDTAGSGSALADDPSANVPTLDTEGLTLSTSGGYSAHPSIRFMEGNDARARIYFDHDAREAILSADGSLILEARTRVVLHAETITVGRYTLPQQDGTPGQVLTTDGNGTLSWTDP